MTVGSVSSLDTPSRLSAARGSLLPLALFLTLVSVAAILGGSMYFRNESSEIQDGARRQLELIGELKQAQLEHWRSERLGDGEVLLTRNTQSVYTHEALSKQPTPDSEDATRAWLAGYITAYQQYDRAYLVGANATVRIAIAADATPPARTLIDAAQTSMRTGQVQLVDFYRDDTDGDRPFLGLISPVLDGPGGAAIGAVILRIDPATFVWRALSSDVGSSLTGETELIRRDGPETAMVLSPERSVPQSALALQLPAVDPARLSTMALSGRVGLVTAIDHRGIEVLASIAPIRNSPWVVVTHIDSAELRARLRRHLWLVSTGVILLILSIAAVLVLWRHDQRMRGYRKQAELSEAVRSGEERLRLALSSASQGLFDLNLLTGETLVSPEYATMLGHDPEAFVETVDRWRSRLHPDDAARTIGALDGYLAGAEPTYHAEFRLRTAAGGWKWVLAAGQIAARTAEGRPKRMLGTHTDITQLKWAQEGQSRATAQLRNLLAHSPTIVYSVHVIAGQPRLVAVSENIERILGYTPLEGMHPDFWPSYAHPDDRDRVQATAARVAAEGEVVQQYRFRRRDGSWAWMQDQMTVVRRDAAGLPLEMAGAWSDITQQHEAEQGLRESEERLRLAMISARQGFWDLDLGAGRAVTSPEYAAMLGFEHGTFQETSERWNARVHPADLPHSLQVFDDYVSGRRHDYDLELRQRHVNGHWLWIHSVGRAVEWGADGRPSRMIGIHTDITARKTAELAADQQARLYRTLSLCNEAIVRSTSADELFPQVCAAAVEAGGFMLAFIGMVDPATRSLDIVATHGEPLAHLDGVSRSMDPDAPGAPPSMAQVLREQRAFWVDNFHTNPSTAHLSRRAAANGIIGGAVIPLVRAGETVGLFAVYSSLDQAFDSEARTLLTQVAADVSFALDSFDREQRRITADLERQQAEERYRRMFEESGVPMLLIDATTGAIADANRAAATFYGWDMATLRRMHIGHISTMPASELTDALHRIRFGGQQRHSFQHRLASGEVRDVDAFTAAITVDDQPRVLAMVVDVTARNAAVAALFEKEYELTEAQRLAHVGSWTLDPGGRNQWSDEMFRIFGLDDGQGVPSVTDFRALVHPDDLPKVLAQMALNEQGEGGTPIDYRLVRPDGAVRYVNARGERREDAGGHAYLAGTVQDVTELRASEAALRIKDRAIESSLNAIAIAGLDGHITYVNEAFAELWAFDSAASVVGRSAQTFFTSEAQALEVIRVVSEHGQWSGEMRAAAQDGRTLDLLVSAVMVAGDSGEPVCMVGAFVDITARKHAEQTLVSSLQEKEALLKEVHHRVKNNLQVISSLLRLEFGRTSDAGVKSVLGEMQGRIASMALLHETLYRADNLAHVDLSMYLNRLVNQIFRSMAPSSGRVALRVAIEPTAVDLEQAVPCGLLVNELVSNSLKHAFQNNDAGEVHVALTHVDGGPQLRLIVSDTGPGLPANLAERRDQTLGLQLVSDLSRQLRGTLSVGDGPGTTFTLVFTPRLAHAGGAPQ